MLRIRQLNKTYPGGIQEQDVEAEEIPDSVYPLASVTTQTLSFIPSFSLGSERTIETGNRFNGLFNPAAAVGDVTPCGLSLKKKQAIWCVKR
jgi:hypothetical protein